jgi:hypothetical protein
MENIDYTLALIGVLVAAGFFCAGAALGAWRIERAEAAAYRKGREAGMGEAARIYSRPPIDRVPTIRSSPPMARPPNLKAPTTPSRSPTPATAQPPPACRPDS